MDRAALVALVALSCTLAGCGGFVGSGPATETETVTPADVPTLAPVYPPGISRTGLDAEPLVQSHRRSLFETSYTIDASLRYGPVDGAVHNVTSIHQIGNASRPIRIVRTRTETQGRADWVELRMWYDGEQTTIWQRSVGGTSRANVYDGGPPAGFAYVSVIRTVFANLDRSSVSQSDGATVVVGSVTRADVLPAPAFASNLSNATMSVRVHPDGYVERLSLGYDATVDGERVDMRFTMHVHSVGTTTVRRPDWVDTASDPGEATERN